MAHPRDQGDMYLQKRIGAGDNVKAVEVLGLKEIFLRNRERIAYAMAKANTEKMIYKMAEDDANFEAISINPLHVIGPLMTENALTSSLVGNSLLAIIKRK